MMFQECPACHTDGVHSDGPYKSTCTCENCDAQFEIESDVDFDSVIDGESYVDQSTVGERIDQ